MGLVTFVVAAARRLAHLRERDAANEAQRRADVRRADEAKARRRRPRRNG